MKRKLLLIDLSNAWHMAWHSSADLEISAAFEKTLSRVRYLSQGFDLVAVCCDSPPYKRKELFPEYKAQREAHPAMMLEQFRRTKARLKADGYLLWEVAGYECDDVIATAVQFARDDELDVTIASSDKDLLSLVDDEAPVRVRSLATEEVFDAQGVISKFGVAPRLIPDLLALMGDKSDNIPGIPKVGPKNGAALLRDYGNALNVVECAGEIKGAIGEAIRTHGGNVAMALKLVTLDTEVPLDWDALFAERPQEPLNDEEWKEDMDGEDTVEGEFEDSDPEAAISPPVEIPKAAPAPKPASQPQASKAIAERAPDVQAIVRVPVHYTQALEPQTMGQAFKLATGLHESRLYERFKSPAAIWAVMMRGREMGIGALTALDVLHNFQGRVMMHAHLIIAKAKADPDCEYFQCIETTPERAVYVTKNRCNPTPTKLTYTIEQAKLAGLLRQGGNWAQRPDEMLRKTCGVQLVRMEYPMQALGIFCPEELGDDAIAMMAAA
jgi:5'-3' exonuclease